MIYSQFWSNCILGFKAICDLQIFLKNLNLNRMGPNFPYSLICIHLSHVFSGYDGDYKKEVAISQIWRLRFILAAQEWTKPTVDVRLSFFDHWFLLSWRKNKISIEELAQEKSGFQNIIVHVPQHQPRSVPKYKYLFFFTFSLLN